MRQAVIAVLSLIMALVLGYLILGALGRAIDTRLDLTECIGANPIDYQTICYGE